MQGILLLLTHRGLIIDTHNYIGGKKILIDVKNIKEVQWANAKVILNISVAAVKECITFDESQFDHIESTNLSPANN